MYDASDLSPIVMVEVRTLSFGGTRDAAVCAPTTCAQQELGISHKNGEEGLVSHTVQSRAQ